MDSNVLHVENMNIRKMTMIMPSCEVKNCVYSGKSVDQSSDVCVLIFFCVGS